MIEYLFFDLDGTLTDPGEGITNSVKYALSRFGINVEDKRELYSFIGPPLYDSFRERFGLSHEDAEQAVVYYREYFAPKGLFENTVYDGIPELLQKLNDKGIKSVLATSKPEPFAITILEHFDLKKYFYAVYGATMDEKRNKKDAVIAYALGDLRIEPANAVMIGDRKFDVEGGHVNGLVSVGVLYGYGDRAEMTEAKADFIAEDVSALENILLNKIC